MATPLQARPCSPPHCCFRLFHLDVEHKQKLGHETQETRSLWPLWGAWAKSVAKEETSGGDLRDS